MDRPKNEMDILTPSPSGSGLILVASSKVPDKIMLELVADRLDEPITTPSNQLLALIAQQLIRLGITGEGAMKLAYSIGGVAARLGRVKDDHPDEPTESGDASLAHLLIRMNETTEPILRAWRACDLGDRSLMFASRWAGRHLDSNMKEAERRRYCMNMASTSYEQAVVLSQKGSQRSSGWMEEALPPLIDGVNVATAVLAGLHTKHTPQAQLITELFPK